ncbi:MAG: serine/threonine protein kinase, partial [Bradymonadaceae bacterium]
MGNEYPQQFGQYTLHELIGRGGMAEIYRATMPGIGGFEKTVAIKKILPHLAQDDEFTSMLIDEARIIESLDHSNIAQVFDLGKREGTYYIAMEYIHGLDLSEIIDELDDRDEYIPLPHVIHITSSICAGLHFVHTQTDDEGNPLNVIHRDISPHNIRLSFAGEVKIIDFGVAKAADREAHTKMGVIKGKLLYMAPEQAKAEDLDGRADLFATGLCAYKMLTGELPFEGDNEFQVYNNILQKDIVSPKKFRPEIPEKLDRIVMKLLRRDPGERYQEGYEAKQDLDRLLHDVAPGYTVNRLSSWVEENFSHLVQQETETDEKTVTSNPSDVAPATPTGQRHPGTGEHGAAELEAQQTDSEQVPEPVPAEGGQPAGEPTNQSTDPAHHGDGEHDAPQQPRRTETSSDEATGQFAPGPQDGGSGPPRVVYAIAALVVAIAAMVGYAVMVRQDSGGNKPIKKKKPTPGITDDSPKDPGMINSTPEDAKLVRKGEVVGRTPIKFVLPKSDEAIELTLVKSGFGDQTLKLVPSGDLDKTIELTATGDTGVG